MEKRELEQWFFKITEYADRLLKNIEKIDWDEKVKIAQKNWIGRSEGALIKFAIRNSQFDILVFTTRPDTLFGATYMVVGPEHELLANNELGITNYEEVKRYIDAAKKKIDEERIAEGKEKTGVELKGIKAINPANKEEIPVFVADYVLGHVGTGAIMAVPAHDERDFDFAKKFNLPVRIVIEPVFTQSTEPGKVVRGLPFEERDAIIAIVKHWSADTYIALKWKKVSWGTFITGGIEEGQTAEETATMEIREETGFLHPKLVGDFGLVHGKFYHVPKKVNRFAHSRVLYFNLEDGAQENITEEEREKHEVLWLTREELKQFLTPDTHQRALEMLNGKSVYIGTGILANSGKFDGIDSEEAKWKITEFVGGKRQVNYRLRDWLISRQRYWGPPIPMIFCDSCGWNPVPENDLPVKLPFVKNFRPTGSGKSPLASVRSFYETKCPKCGKKARRETDVSDTFLDSAWYFIGYLAKTNSKFEIRNSKFRQRAKRWLPVNMYIGGLEHSVLHLLYSRFITMALHDMGLLEFEEPFTKFIGHGLITKDGAKMSKSKGNIVNPDEYIRAFGADAIRMYLAFLAPLTEGGDFRDSGIKGITRFLERIYRFVNTFNFPIRDHLLDRDDFRKEIEPAIHKTIKKVTRDIESLQYNTAISALMILFNKFEDHPEGVDTNDVEIFLKLLAPFAPFLAEELWQRRITSYRLPVTTFRSIHLEPWPHHDESLLREETFDLIIQVNGKMRGRTSLPIGTSEKEAKESALKIPSVKQFVSGEPKRVVFVPNKLINFVV